MWLKFYILGISLQMSSLYDSKFKLIVVYKTPNHIVYTIERHVIAKVKGLSNRYQHGKWQNTVIYNYHIHNIVGVHSTYTAFQSPILSICPIATKYLFEQFSLNRPNTYTASTADAASLHAHYNPSIKRLPVKKLSSHFSSKHRNLFF